LRLMTDPAESVDAVPSKPAESVDAIPSKADLERTCLQELAALHLEFVAAREKLDSWSLEAEAFFLPMFWTVGNSFKRALFAAAYREANHCFATRIPLRRTAELVQLETAESSFRVHLNDDEAHLRSCVEECFYEVASLLESLPASARRHWNLDRSLSSVLPQKGFVLNLEVGKGRGNDSGATVLFEPGKPRAAPQKSQSPLRRAARVTNGTDDESGVQTSPPALGKRSASPPPAAPSEAPSKASPPAKNKAGCVAKVGVTRTVAKANPDRKREQRRPPSETTMVVVPIAAERSPSQSPTRLLWEDTPLGKSIKRTVDARARVDNSVQKVYSVLVGLRLSAHAWLIVFSLLT
jgi:hypothetical protein